MEIVCLGFDPHGLLCATGSMDHSAKIWDVE
jgi:WD40 repeat protein